MQKGGLSNLMEPMKNLSASSASDLSMRLVAESPSLPLRHGSDYPLLLLVTVTLYQCLNPLSHATLLSHPPLSQNKTKAAVSQPEVHSPLWSYLGCLPLPQFLSASSGQQLALGQWCIQSSTAVPAKRRKGEERKNTTDCNRTITWETGLFSSW